MRPPDALRRRTHFLVRLNSHRHTRQDKTVAETQARQAATPSRPTAHTQRRCTPRKCEHAVDCCIWRNLNFFTKRHDATRVIYRLTVQTLADGLETQFRTPDTTQTGLADSLVVSGGWCELGVMQTRSRYGDYSCWWSRAVAAFRELGLSSPGISDWILAPAVSYTSFDVQKDDSYFSYSLPDDSVRIKSDVGGTWPSSAAVQPCSSWAEV